MLAIQNINFLSIPMFNIPDINEIVTSGVEKQLKKTLQSISEDEKRYSNFAYKTDKTIPQKDMKYIEKIDDFYLFYLDTLEEIIEDKENKQSNLYKYFDEIYTLVLKITTSISYIRSRNRQLSNVA